MRALSTGEMFEWFQNRGVEVSSDRYLYFAKADRLSIDIRLPGKAYELIALANALLPYSETVEFGGAVLWIRESGIWSEIVERVGGRVLELVRFRHGDKTASAELQACLFEREDLVDLQVCLSQPLLVGWDAFLVPSNGDYFVAISHDESISIITREIETQRRMTRDLSNWSPLENQASYFRGTSIPASQSS